MVLALAMLGPMLAVVGSVVLFGLADPVAKILSLFAAIWFMLSPAILFPAPGPPSEPPGSGGGGGGGPPEPPSRPDSPAGGIPLADAEQSRRRVREHQRPGPRRPRPRPPAREPGRAPVRLPGR